MVKSQLYWRNWQANFSLGSIGILRQMPVYIGNQLKGSTISINEKSLHIPFTKAFAGLLFLIL
jgi:hypothetical protein